MRMEDLKYLLEIERCQSINKAAQHLFLSHSTLSYNLQNIERELGYEIFTRSKKGVFPTPRGREVLNGCRIILELIDHWHDRDDGSKEIKGHVQVTAIPIFARMFGLDILMKLRQEYPGLVLHFEEKKLFFLENLLSMLTKTSSRIFVASLSDPEHAVFDYRFKDDESWSSFSSSADALVLHVSAKHPLGNREFLYPEELSQLPLLFYPDSGGQFGYSRILRYFSATQPYNISTAEQVLNMVEKNLSVSLASRLSTSQSSAVKNGTVRCIPIHGFSMPMNYCVLFPSERIITPAERVVVECLRQCIDAMVSQAVDNRQEE